MSQKKPGWRRNEYGTWHLPGTGYTITRETDDAGKEFWMCRANGIAFDRACTLAEAKGYCQPEPGKPVIDIL